jgi:hypothetical protein
MVPPGDLANTVLTVDRVGVRAEATGRRSDSGVLHTVGLHGGGSGYVRRRGKFVRYNLNDGKGFLDSVPFF